MVTENTQGISQGLRDAIYLWLDDGNTVPLVSAVEEHREEMEARFGAPVPTGYMSEEQEWRLDESDADAIRSYYEP